MTTEATTDSPFTTDTEFFGEAQILRRLFVVDYTCPLCGEAHEPSPTRAHRQLPRPAARPRPACMRQSDVVLPLLGQHIFLTHNDRGDYQALRDEADSAGPKDHLRVNSVTMTAESELSCDACAKRFSTGGEMNQHMGPGPLDTWPGPAPPTARTATETRSRSPQFRKHWKVNPKTEGSRPRKEQAMTTASSAAAIESSSGPPFFADGAEPRFHWERTAGQVALSVDPHQRTPRLERAVLWLMGETQRASGRMKITTELVRQVHQIINPDLGMYAGLCTHETLPLMARLESLYQARGDAPAGPARLAHRLPGHQPVPHRQPRGRRLRAGRPVVPRLEQVPGAGSISTGQ